MPSDSPRTGEGASTVFVLRARWDHPLRRAWIVLTARPKEAEGGRGDLGSSRHALSGPPLSGEQPASSVGEHGPETPTGDDE